MIGEKKAANAIGGRTVRACDSCLLKRARWFCAADDAFLCQACNTSVHSANELASRHERVRLQTSSFKGMNDANRNSIYSSTADEDDDEYSPKWLRGFTRKARTPRHNNKAVAAVQQASKDGDIDKALNDLPFVPEMSNEEDQSPISEGNKEEDELLYQVPVFDPFAAELCKPIGDEGVRASIKGNEDYQLGQQADEHEFDHQLQGFLQSDLELAEFTADVESLLGVAGLEEDQSCNDHDIKGLELDDLLGCKEEDDDFDIDMDIDVNFNEVCVNTTDLESRVKVEDGESVLGCDQVMNLNSSTNDHENFGSELSPAEMKKKNASLRLNYEAVIAAWASQGSPWMTGIRPEVKPDHGWLDCVDMRCTDFRHSDGDWGGLIVGSRLSDGGREARVSRYREKRRTRLFSKKIRYEVRKLNAEKRPRMKGRFVKRTSFMGISNTNNTTTNSTTTFPYHFMNK